MSKLFSLAWLALAGAACLPSHLAAQVPQAAPEVDAAVPAAPPARRARPAAKPAATAVVPQVTVQGARANETETRRNATASKMIFGREELDRNGDSSVGEILKRLPGVTMGGPPGRGGGGGVRMRGLGNGYTQMLVNGERPPAGFSLESLSPDQVERIEIMRGPVAEHSTQAIAGTINIVLREGYQQKDVQLKLADGVERGLHSPSVSITVPGKIGSLTWLLNASLSQNRQQDDSGTLYQDIDGSGALLKDQTIAAHSDRSSRGIHVMPRLSYKFDNGDTLNFQPFIVSNRSHSTSDSLLLQRVGPPQREYATALSSGEASADFFRGFGNWLHRIEGGARLDVKFGFGAGRTRSTSLRYQFDDAGAVKEVFNDDDDSKNSGLTSGGKYTRSVGKGHLLAAGWDGEATRRTQSTTALVNGQAQFAQSGENLSADTRRLAGFVQDEWDITPQWGVYLGLRWEGIRTGATNRGRDTTSTTSVWSPVLHTVWRIPGHDKDQVRASLTQSYKAPQLNDLIAVPTFSQLNGPTRPDRTGNPDLKPELAKGIDLAYEHYIGKSGILSASAFVRKIDNLMRRELSVRQTPTGLRWLSTPSNIGSARTSGIELEAKFPLTDVMAGAPNMDLRANYSRFWSNVDGIPGPDNRLDQQAYATANMGLDYRLKQLPLTVGGSYNWTPPIVVQTSLTERVTAGAKRQADIYGLWKFSPATQLRIAANNLAAADYLTGRVVTTDGVARMAATTAHTFTTWSARLEMKL